MSGVSDTVSKVIDFITGGLYESDGEDDPFETLEKELGTSTKYPVVDNTAKKVEYATTPIKNRSKEKESNVVSMGGRETELMVVEPRSFSENSMQLIGYLQEGRTIVLNLHLLDKEQAQRLVDFVSGATQALNGNQQKIADTVFIFAPKNIAISADTLKAKSTLTDAIWDQRRY